MTPGQTVLERIMNKLLVVAFAAVALTFSCAGNSSRQGEETVADSSALVDSAVADTFVIPSELPIPESADEFFDDFFFNFIGDDALQKSRTVFPLIVSADSIPIDTITRQQWMTETFFLDQEYYTLILDNEEQMETVKDANIDDVVVEMVLLNTKTVRQYFFKRDNGLWKLQSINNQPLYKNRNESFLSFYDQFSTDSAFQMKHLHPTVAFSSPDPDDDFSRIEGVITHDTWLAFVPVLPTGTIYNIVYGGVEDKKSTKKIFIIRGISNGEETVFTFHWHSNRWCLEGLDT